MKNVFILYIPPGNYEAMVHYEDTIKNKVSPDRIYKYVDSNLRDRLQKIFGNSLIAVWGSRTGDSNRSRFSKMRPGDDILIIEGENIKLLGKIADKTENYDLSNELWKNLKGDSSSGWDLIYFIANPVEINLPFAKLKELFNYKESWSLRGFTNISNNKLEEFYTNYDDLYSILVRLKHGETINSKVRIDQTIGSEDVVFADEDANVEQVEKEISEHIIMQWRLTKLGKKAGSKVWVPRSDQGKLTKNYDFSGYEEEFTVGIDMPARYVEQIDVVWKKEFQIDAAFEIENTTSIYSGLLRFADLEIVAPNHPYPLFIVAPTEKKEKVFNQIKHPVFQKMGFGEKVRYLSYEAIAEIDEFFSHSTSGLNASILMGKSEEVV